MPIYGLIALTPLVNRVGNYLSAYEKSDFSVINKIDCCMLIGQEINFDR